MTKIIEGHIFNPASHAFTPEDFKNMANAVGCADLDNQHQTALQGLCNGYLILLACWQQSPRPAAVRDHLHTVHTHSVKLMKTLHSLHNSSCDDSPARQAALEMLHYFAPGNVWAEKDNDLMNFTGGLELISVTAKKAIANLPDDPGGKDGDAPLDFLICSMAPLFTKITNKNPGVTYDSHNKNNEIFRRDGENYNPDDDSYNDEDDSSIQDDIPEPYSGKFIRLLTTFLAPLDAQYRISNQGLGKKVQRVLAHLHSE